MKPTILAIGGGGFLMETDRRLDDWVLSATGKKRPRVCFIPTAGGDATHQITRFYEFFPSTRCEASHLALFRRNEDDLREFLAKQDLLYVGGGSTANLLAVWRLHGLPKILRDAWEAGVVLAGVSAGAMCWFEGGLTDSFSPALTPIGNALAFLRGSFCPHYGNEPARRPALRIQIEQSALPDGYAADDGVALRFEGDQLAEAITTRDGARAFRVSKTDGKFVETELPTRRL